MVTKQQLSALRLVSLCGRTVPAILERIADHAKNMAEEVVYLCEARDIRHTGPQEPAPGAQPDVTKL